MNEIENAIATLPFPDLPSTLDDRVAQTLASVTLSTDEAPSHSYVRRAAIIGVAAAASAIVLGWALQPKSAIAFGDVVVTAKQVQTIQYVFKDIYFDALPAGGLSVKDQNGEYQMRTDIPVVVREHVQELETQKESVKSESELAELDLRTAWIQPYASPKQPLLNHAVRVRASAGGMETREGIFPSGGDSISNAKTGLSVSFDMEKKIRYVIRKFMKRDPKKAAVPMEGLDNDVIKSLITIPPDAVKRLPGKMVRGIRTVGFRKTTQMNGGTVHRDIWVQPESKLPVQIEVWFTDDGAETPESYSVYDHFVYNEPLDESMFDTSLPAGFTSKDLRVVFSVSEDEEE